MRKSLIGSFRRWRLELGLDLPPSTGTREALQYLMMARLGVLYVVLGGVVLHQVFRGEDVPERRLYLGYALLALSFAFGHHPPRNQAGLGLGQRLGLRCDS